jgi:hypothetical protein
MIDSRPTISTTSAFAGAAVERVGSSLIIGWLPNMAHRLASLPNYGGVTP